MFRRLITSAALGVTCLLGASTLAAAQSVDASYAATYEPVADDCEGDGLKLAAGPVALNSADGKLTVSMKGVTPLKGRRAADGQFKAQAKGPGAKPDLRGKYSVSGKATKDSIEMVFIAQFYRGKRPLCTQSWTVSGTRKK